MRNGFWYKRNTMFAHILLVWAHVPTYGGCVENCCTPPHAHTTSQVIYLKGSGGLEIHLESESVPFDTLGSEFIDVDVVFRDAIDPSTYSLYLGCGGCVASKDPIVIPPVTVQGYEPAEVEPFTQTQYRSIFPKAARTYNTSGLRFDVCPERHFTIRLVDYGNRTDDGPIIWGPVVGLGESFTIVELLSFPLFILWNHGEVWNGHGWTWWLWLFVGAPLLINAVREFLRWRGVKVLDPWPWTHTYDPGVMPYNFRELFYELALIGFTAAALEELTHLFYAQAGAPVGYGLWVGLFLVILLGQGIPIAFVCFVWTTLRNPTWCISFGGWWLLEVLIGVGFFFLLGAGFFLGPASVVIAGFIRGYDPIEVVDIRIPVQDDIGGSTEAMTKMPFVNLLHTPRRVAKSQYA